MGFVGWTNKGSI